MRSDDTEADAVFAQLLASGRSPAADASITPGALARRLRQLGVAQAGSTASRLYASMAAASGLAAAASGRVDLQGFRLGFDGYCNAVMGEDDARWLERGFSGLNGDGKWS